MPTSETLRSVIDAGRSTKRLDELSTARVIGKIAEQMHAAQQKAGAGKAIGPITPAGIAIDVSGAPRLGLAEPAAVTYSSPEQLGGDPGDRRSDVFSLGIVMWEALTHEPLFADAAAVKTKAITSPSELNANTPAELGAICMKALARKPADRYQSAKVMAAEIEAVLDDAGYADTDERIAEFLAELGKPPALPKVTLITPPLGLAPAPAATAATPPATPRPTEAARLPSELDKPARLVDTLPSLGAPLQPKAPAEPSIVVEAALAADTKVEPATMAKSVLGPIPGGDAVAPAPLAPAPTPAKADLPVAKGAETVIGFAPLAAPSPASTPLRPADPSPAQSEPVLLATPRRAPSAPILPDDPRRVTQVAPPPRRDATPHPASIVSLPKKRAESQQEQLGGWAWSTDSNPALPAYTDTDTDTEYDDAPPPSSRKTLLYMIGGGVAVAALVTIIMVSFGGSSESVKQPEPQPAAVMQEPAAALPPAGSDLAMAAGSSLGGSAGSAVDGSAVDGSAVAAAALPPIGSDVPAPGSNVAAATAVAPPRPDAPTPPDAAVVAIAPPPPPIAAPAKHEAPRPKHIEPPHRAEPPRVAHADRSERSSTLSAADVENAYKQGLQLYMHGDASAALASFRAAVAGNPSYAPAWRGLGLVFEKLGEIDQARAAYRRYLQLAPTASDADHLRNRLERLGP